MVHVVRYMLVSPFLSNETAGPLLVPAEEFVPKGDGICDEKFIWPAGLYATLEVLLYPQLQETRQKLVSIHGASSLC